MQRLFKGTLKMAVFWDVAPCSVVEIDRRFRRGLIALMMKAVSTSETSVNFYQRIRHNIPEESHLHTRLRENLNCHKRKNCFQLADTSKPLSIPHLINPFDAAFYSLKSAFFFLGFYRYYIF
jgi:hypothetical protein